MHVGTHTELPPGVQLLRHSLLPWPGTLPWPHNFGPSNGYCLGHIVGNNARHIHPKRQENQVPRSPGIRQLLIPTRRISELTTLTKGLAALIPLTIPGETMDLHESTDPASASQPIIGEAGGVEWWW